MRTLKKISLIMPIYNVEEYLEEALESICNQTLKEFEAILIDDGSTDNSLEIIEKYLKKDKRFKLRIQENSGPSMARNRGINDAVGEYVIFMDSDDVLPIDSLERRYQIIKKQDAEIGVFASYKYDGKNKWIMKNHFLREGIFKLEDNKELLLTLGPWNKIFKRELIKKIEFPTHIKYAEDQAFIMEAYLRAKQIYVSRYLCYFHRVRPKKAKTSLTGEIIKNPNFVMQQTYESWKISKENIKKYCKNKKNEKKISYNYFERILKYDIWPPLINILKNGNNKESVDAFIKLEKIIKITDKNIVNESKELRFILSYGIMKNKKNLKKESMQKYIEIFKKVYMLGDNNLLRRIYCISIINGIKYNIKKISLRIKKEIEMI